MNPDTLAHAAPARLRTALLLLASSLVLAAAGCDPRAELRDPDAAQPLPAAPDSFTVAVETSAGAFEMRIVRALSPLAVDRLHFLVEHDFYRGSRFYRVVEGFVAQFGVSGDPVLDSLWVNRGVPDEPVRASNTRGAVTFARAGTASRSTVLFINLADNTDLDSLDWDGVVGFPPIGRVTSGMEVVDRLHGGYGEAPGAFMDAILIEGNPFFARQYPQLDSVLAARVTGRW